MCDHNIEIYLHQMAILSTVISLFNFCKALHVNYVFIYTNVLQKPIGQSTKIINPNSYVSLTLKIPKYLIHRHGCLMNVSTL